MFSKNRSGAAMKKNYLLQLFAGILLIAVLLLIPTGYEDAVIYQNAERAVVIVTDTDNSNILKSGLIMSGEQSCELYVTEGMFKGKTIRESTF